MKYAALSAVGYSADDLRILIVEDKTFHRPHSVVAVRDRTRWLILNNRSSAIVEVDDFLNYYRFLSTLDPDNLLEFVRRADRYDGDYSITPTAAIIFCRSNDVSRSMLRHPCALSRLTRRNRPRAAGLEIARREAYEAFFSPKTFWPFSSLAISELEQLLSFIDHDLFLPAGRK